MFFSQLFIKDFSRDLVLLHEILTQNRNTFEYSAKVLRYHGVFLSFFILLRHFAPWERIHDSLVLWTPSRVFRILRTEFQSSSVELGFRIPIVLGFEFLELFSGFLSLGFRFRIPRVTISQFPESKFPFTRDDTVDHQGGRERDICLSLHVLVLTNFMFSILKWWFLRATFASTFSTPIYNERKIWFFVCTMPSKNCWKALSRRFHVSSNIKGIPPQTQKLEAPCTA